MDALQFPLMLTCCTAHDLTAYHQQAADQPQEIKCYTRLKPTKCCCSCNQFVQPVLMLLMYHHHSSVRRVVCWAVVEDCTTARTCTGVISSLQVKTLMLPCATHALTSQQGCCRKDAVFASLLCTVCNCASMRAMPEVPCCSLHALMLCMVTGTPDSCPHAGSSCLYSNHLLSMRIS